MQTQTKCYIGIDVSKETLAFSSEGAQFSCKNKKAAVLKVLRRLQQKAQGRQLWLACEATGVYHRTLAICADTMGLPLSVLTPSRVHAFTRACGQLARACRHIRASHMCAQARWMKAAKEVRRLA